MAKIKVILLEDVAGQGRKGEIVSVSDGYAHNFLFKNKKGVLASDEELKKIENQKKKDAKKAEELKEKSIEIKKILEAKVVTLKIKAGTSGKLFGGVTNKEVSQVIKEEFNLDIDKKKIECNIKSLGENTATIKLHSEVKAILKISVIAK